MLSGLFGRPKRACATRETLPELGLTFELTRKAIKRAYLRVRPPDGQISINAPLHMPISLIHGLIRQHHPWILKKQNQLQQSARTSPQSCFEHGQMVHLFGEPHTLNINPNARQNRTKSGAGILQVDSKTSLPPEPIRARINAHLSQQLAAVLEARHQYWAAKMGVNAQFIGIKRMKTRWGSCNIPAQRIWINLELARMPLHCIDLVLVHELTHLLERGHNARFYGFMDQFLPEWRAHQAEIKRWGMIGL